MTLVARVYPDIVADVLTNLTRGVSGELHAIPAYDRTARPVRVPDVVLERRPVRRVSLVSGFVEEPDGSVVPHAFTRNDYDLVPSGADPGDLDTLRFLPFGRKPAPESELRVNYYPRAVEPAVITDIGVGSVARTLVEALSRELAVVYAQLNLAYESAFVDTATGSSLDRVVALLGIRRYRAGRPVGTVRFSRRAGSPGTIFIPPGTPVTDTEDKVRYETVDGHLVQPLESAAEVRVRGTTDDTPVAEPNVLTVVQRVVAGIDEVTNERATTRGSEDETDDELRVRARSALTAVNKGTVSAIENGLLALPDVRAVGVEEYPNGVPGEIRVNVSLTDPARTTLPPAVLERIDELRPAGVRVDRQIAAGVVLQVGVALVLAGAHLPASEVTQLQEQARDRLVELVRRAGVGQRVRTGPLVAALLSDERIVDATLTLAAAGTPPPPAGTDFEPAPDTIVKLAPEDVTFAPETFEQELAEPSEIVVDVRAAMRVAVEPGTAVGDVQPQIAARLTTWLSALVPGDVIDAGTILTVLRDDARYQIDPLTLEVTLAFAEQFVRIAQGGGSHAVAAGQRFVPSSIEVSG